MIVLAALGVGLLTDAALDGPTGVGLTSLVAGLAIAIVAACRPRPAGIVFLTVAVIVSIGASIRTSPTLVALISMTAAGLLGLGAAYSAGGDPLTTTIRGYLHRGLASIGSLPSGARALVEPARVAIAGEGRDAMVMLRSLLLIVPVVVVLTALLGSADAVFAGYLRAPLDAVPDALPAQMARIALGAVVCSTLVARGRRLVDTTATEASTTTPWPSGREWTVLLAIVVAVFAGFVAIQLTVFFGGRTHVVTERGLTYAEYARSGFWQLLAAVGIAGLVIAGAWSAGARERTRAERRTFTVLAVSLIGLVLVVLASAFERLTLYEDTFGFTWPRLLVHAAIVALGASMITGAVAVLWGRARWLPTAMVAIGVVTVATLTMVDPERVIATRNLERFERTGRIDVAELTSLSPDATPVLAAALPSLPACERDVIGRELASQKADLDRGDGWASWNLGRHRARSAIEELDPSILGRAGRSC